MFNNNFLNRPVTEKPALSFSPTPQSSQFNPQQQFTTQPQQQFRQQQQQSFTTVPPQQQQFGQQPPQQFIQEEQQPQQQFIPQQQQQQFVPQQQQQFTEPAENPRSFQPQQSFANSLGGQPQADSEQSLFAMLNREAADRPVHSRQENAAQRNIPKYDD